VVFPSKGSTSLIANLSFAECHKRKKFMCKACTVSVVLLDSRRWGGIWSWRYFEIIIFLTRSRDSLVCVVTSLWDGRPRNRGSFPGISYRLFPFRIIYILALWQTQPPLLLVLGGVEIKWPRREAEHSSPSSAEVNNSCS
jgi:hypothetical protein